MRQINRTLGTAVLILASLGAMSCAPKMSQYKPDSERTSRPDRQTVATQVTHLQNKNPQNQYLKSHGRQKAKK